MANTLWLAPSDSYCYTWFIGRYSCSACHSRISPLSFPPPLPSFPRKRESSPNGSRIKCGMTGGAGSPIRSASLSVEDDKGAFGWGWQRMCHSRSLLLSFPWKRESSPNGSRIKCGMTGGAGSPIRSASLSVEDDKGAFGWGWHGGGMIFCVSCETINLT